MTKSRYVLSFGIGGVALLLLVVVLGRTLPPGVEFSSVEPESETPELEPLESQESTLFVPFSISVDLLENALEIMLPRSASESKEIWEVPSVDLIQSWKRSGLTLAGKNNGFIVEGDASATFRLKSFRASVSADVEGRVRGVVQPRLDANWNVPSVVDVRITNPSFSSKVLFGRWEVPALFERYVRSLERGFERKLISFLQENLPIKRLASEVWENFCGSIRVSENPEGWLEIHPLRIRAAQPVIDERTASLHLGLDVRFKLTSEKTIPTCAFPEGIDLVETPPTSEVRVILPAYVDYGALTEALKKLTVGRHRGKNIVVTVEDINVRPYGASLLLAVDLSIVVPRLFGTRARGSVYIVAKPTIDAEKSTLIIGNVELDTESRNIVLSLIGELAERKIKGIFEQDLVYNLKPVERMLADQAHSTFKTLPAGPFSIVGKVEDISFKRVDIGPSEVRVVANALGTVAVEVVQVPFPNESETDR